MPLKRSECVVATALQRHRDPRHYAGSEARLRRLVERIKTASIISLIKAGEIIVAILNEKR